MEFDFIKVNRPLDTPNINAQVDFQIEISLIMFKKNLENIVVKPASIWNSFSENINWFLDILNKEFKIRWDYKVQFRDFKGGWR